MARVEHVEISPVRAEVGLGLTMLLEATAYDADGERVPTAIFEWESSDADTVSVDDRGSITAESLGTAAITARAVTHPEVQGSSQITVVEGDIASVVIAPDPIQVLPQRTSKAIATAYNEAVEPVDASPAVWRVEDEAIATVDSDGIVEGVAPGQTRLIANIEGVEGGAAIEVLRMPVDRVEISPSAPTTAVGETVQLEATGFDGDGKELSGRQAQWTSDNTGIATVDAKGLVRGVAVGSVSIGVKMGVVTSKVTATIVEANHAPIARDHIASTQEDSAVDLTLGASDGDDDPLSFSIESDPSHGTLSAFDAAAGTLTYTPDVDYVGSDSFTFSVTDGEDRSSVATVTIRVGGVNDAPIAQDDTATTEEDAPVTVDVLANDSDPEGDNLSVSVSTQPSNGSAAVANNSIVYTPNADFHGRDRLTYEITDASAGAVSATLALQVTPVNDAPMASGDTVATDEDQSVSIDVLANDSDVDGDSLSVTSTNTSAQGVGVTVASDGTLTYTPPSGYTGSDTFDYTVSDGTATASATVSVTVNAVNQAPTAQDDTASAAVDATITISVLSNDSDPDTGDTLSISAIDTSQTTGSVTNNGDGTLDYTAPSAGGTDSFGYTVSDGNGGSDSATVTITVQ